MNLVKNVTHFVYVVWFNFFCLYPFYFAVLCCLKMYHKKKHQIKLDKYSEQLIHQCKYKIGQHKNESMFSIIITGINNLLHLTDIFFFTNWIFVATLCQQVFLLVFFQQQFFFFLLSVCHILAILAILQTFSLLYLLWWSVFSDQWCFHYYLLKFQMMVSIL